MLLRQIAPLILIIIDQPSFFSAKMQFIIIQLLKFVRNSLPAKKILSVYTISIIRTTITGELVTSKIEGIKSRISFIVELVLKSL